MALRTRVAPVRSPATGIGLRLIFTLLGAAGLIASAFFPWISDIEGRDLHVRSLIETTFVVSSNMFATVGFVAIALGLVAVIGLAARFGGLTRIAGALGIVMVVLFGIEVYRETSSVEMQAGAWFALAGSLLAVLAGFLGWRPPAVTTTEPVETVEPVDTP
ncbi:MAG TPA: sugar:proton symporter [Actinomycetes bacterium]|nr:sugar:proton symporter [Actinomycetes bacterium]